MKTGMILAAAALFTAMAAGAARADVINIGGKNYDKDCAVAKLASDCTTKGSETPDQLVRVPGVGSRVSSCTMPKIASCAVK